jgi:hypothetical protein
VSTTCLGSDEGNCCSRIGYCGRNSSYCGAGCQPAFGKCGDPKISTDGSCGGSAGLTCRGAAMGNCCSAMGYCGETASYCGAGCQSAFGDCYGNQSATATGSSAASTATKSPATSQDGALGGPANNDTGVKVGLGIGIPVGILVLAGAVWLLVRRRRRRNRVAELAAATVEDKKDDMTEDSSKSPVSTAQEIDGYNRPAELSDGGGGVHELPSQPYR